jgi:LysR family transcriptional regulator of abg operon
MITAGYRGPAARADSLLARLRFRDLHLLVQLKRSGSLRGAARELHVTQPGLTKALRELERAFGVPLFARTPRGLVPTEQGEVVIHGASLLISELRHLGEETAARASRAAAMLRLGVMPYIATSLLPRVCAALSKLEPPVPIQLHEALAPGLFDALLAGELDALIASYTIEALRTERAAPLIYEKLFDEELAIIAPPGAPLARARNVTLARLADERWVLPPRPAYIRRLIEEAFLREGVIPPAPATESASTATNIQLVAAGAGIGAVPRTAIREALGAGAVKRVHVALPLGSIPIALVYRSTTAHHPRIAFLRTALGLSARNAHRVPP